MKKTYLLAIALVSSLFTSCDMDLAPIGQLDENNALQSVNDVYRFRNGFYTGVRGFSSSAFFSLADLQTDYFNGTVINGNRNGTIANGNLQPGDDDITSYWAVCYGRIANVNYFLSRTEPLYQAAVEADDEDVISYERYLAEAYFFRAYYNCMLFDRYCQKYTAAKAEQEGLGLPIVTEYAPTADRSKYPGRSTMKATVEFIKGDLDKALKGLQEYEDKVIPNLSGNQASDPAYNILLPMSPYVSSYAVKALQARLALWLDDYATALSVSQDIIENGQYALATAGDYIKMWENDQSKEIIFMPYESANELGNAYGTTWISIYSDAADYIPASTLIDALKEAGSNAMTGFNDVRYKTCLGARNLNVNANIVETLCFNKFPGNKELQTGNVNIVNKPKVFRLSESYLIAAEAAAQLNNNSVANEMLNNYLKNRIRNYKEQTLSGNELTNAIRHQRGLEFVGEGFRLSDLRRWEQGFNRADGAHYEYNPEVDDILVNAGLTVVYTSTDHRYTWPIPSDEIQSNPQMAGQQNPGY